MKKNKLKLATKILAILTICLISFVGVYKQNGNRMENVIKDFTLSKDLKGYREITFEVSKEEGDNKSENLKVENYEKSKSIMQKRLEKMNIDEYNISLDKQTGLIYLQIPEDDQTDKVVSNITQIGSVELKDSEDESKVLVSSDKFKQAAALYSTGENGTTVFLELKFNNEGKEIIKNLSENDYKTIPEENTTAENSTAENTTTENSTSEENKDSSEKKEDETSKEKQKKLALYMSGEQITTTSFDEPVKDSIMRLTIGQVSKDSKTISEYISSASTIAAILNNGILPLKYNVGENKYVKTDINEMNIKTVIITISAIIGALLVYMIVKYKLKGLLAAIGYVGFVALYLLVLRYANVIISLEGIVAGVIATILNYIFVMKLLNIKADNSKKYYKEYIKLISKLVPILAIAIIFCFVNVTVLESFGMVMFWGIVLIAIYNILVTKYLAE